MHGKGGSIIYNYQGAGSSANTSKYAVTIQHYINCERLGDEPNSVYLGFYDAGSNSLVKTVTISRTAAQQITKQSFNSCINPVPTVCLYLATYQATIEIADNTAGYILVEQECCRAAGIVNVSNPTSVGFSNYNTIPGVINGVVYRNNSSPALVIKDTAVICYNSYFTIDFGATDPDGDSLSYAFCSAKGTGSSSRQPNPPSAPPYSDITYTSGYSGSQPLGSKVAINENTGLISGTAPATTGPYIISVCISEYRNGVLINVTKKEVLVTVANCSLTAATLDVSYINCDNYTFTFENESSAANITSYYWDFGITTSSADTSTQATPTYTYADTGTYTLKLKVSSAAGCTDSTTSTVKVYPGFTPAFDYTGSCYQSPFYFTDKSVTKYGNISSWSWNFGDATTTNDTSTIKNPSWLYGQSGTVTVTLNVASSKGCNGSINKTVSVNDKPYISLPFTDTLICSNDTLPLIAESSTGSTFSWSPAYNIINATTSNPTVYPYDTTTYTVTVTDKGCVDSATVKVNVLDFITVSIIPDTAMCKGDTIILKPDSYALSYLWQEAGGTNTLSSYIIKTPNAFPQTTTMYAVTGNLGHCQDSASIIVYVSPYPSAYVGNDTTICYGSTAQLYANTVAANYAWSPASTLSNTNTFTPVASPLVTTQYIFSVSDTFYCPKTVTDTQTVTVIQPIIVNAGRDTSIVINQPLQLNATANNNDVAYTWTPITGINNPNIYNPLVTITSTSLDSIIYKVTAATTQGCNGSDYITVKIFKSLPDIFVPSAFTPNGDGKNDIIRPILVGIGTFNFFTVYNRWGQMIYKTAQSQQGWDGTINGKKQDSGTFVYIAQGNDYTGKTIFRKGTFVLIR